MFENRDLYFDSELEGFRAKMDVGPLRLTGLTGTTPSGFLVKKTEVTAGRIEAGGSEGLLGFSYVNVDSGYYREADVAAVDWNFTRGIATIYGEQAWKETNLGSRTDGRFLDRHASYYGLNLNKWNWSLLLEYSNYDYGGYLARSKSTRCLSGNRSTTSARS